MKSAMVTVEVESGDVLTVRSMVRDIIAYETTAKRQKPPWGGVAENPARWESFVAWSALRRTGQIDEPYEAFANRIVQIEFEFDEVPPTSEANGGITSST